MRSGARRLCRPAAASRAAGGRGRRTGPGADRPDDLERAQDKPAKIPLGLPRGRRHLRSRGFPPASLPWPVRGQIVREFGPQPSGARNDGIDIAASEGSAVVAVEDGTVTYAGSDLPGYGNMLLVTHPDGYISV